MHRWRRAAKYAAWYDDEDEEGPKTFNPFRKVRSNSKSHRQKNVHRDAEEGHADAVSNGRALSDPDYRPESAVKREKELRGEKPKHSNTLPDSRISSGDRTDAIDFERTESPIPEQDFSEKDGGEYKDKSVGKPLVNGIQSTSSDPADSAKEQPRVRGRFKGLFKKKEHALASVGDDGSEDKRLQPKYTFANQIRATLLNSWINVLLVAVPVGIALNFTDVNKSVLFAVNFIAIIPLAAMLSYATEEIAMRTGETIGGLLNASFGNAVELIVSIIALLKDEVLVVKSSLIGSMLSNLLLVLGMCFFFGGINRVEQHFNVTVAQTAASLLALAIGSLIIPTAFEQRSSDDGSNGSSVNEREGNLAPLSRGTAVILLIVYGCYLYFQLKTHIEMYNAPSQKTEKRKSNKKEKGEASKGIANIGGSLVSTQGERFGPGIQDQPGVDDDEEDGETPELSVWVAFATLIISTVLVAICAEFMVDGINEISKSISKTFVGLILVPIVGNAAEHATAVTVAIKDKMDLAIGVAVGSSMQIALLVLPLIVILGWITGHNDMTFFFDTFQIAVLFISILLVNYLIQDGKSHWLEGVLLMNLYVLIALACWFYG
ncbi:putative calcium proton exchanger [Phaeomoniella chlamydospora]|uniref:Vacuolar calcium ion transporter n=1 Tax=Phaeomoniella chlamydospora TaxID=158046 RepID=A0A0G2G977_PHACM|nr:putative calcium proton exchanger [Phaeomoniella chlamydospora]